jgi:PleD family two-component response regulator
VVQRAIQDDGDQGVLVIPLQSTFSALVPQGKGEVVLVVEDSAPLRATLQETLTEWGYQVREAVDGVQTLTLLEELGGGQTWC